MAMWEKGSNPPQSFTCKQCGNAFERIVYPSTVGKCSFEFCSPACRNKARALKKIPCPVCGKMFAPRINDTKRGKRVRKSFCSSKCACFAQRGKPSTNPATHTAETRRFVGDYYAARGAEWVANQTGMSIKAVQCLAHKIGVRMHDDVSTMQKQYDAASERMSKYNPMKRPEVVEKVKKFRREHPEVFDGIGLKAVAANQRDKTSKPELRCKQILEAIGIDFVHQAIVKPKFVVDFLIGNLIIQIDGEYWHGHPRFTPLTERQEKQRARDAAQDKYLTACGYSVVRVWESEVTRENIEITLMFYGVSPRNTAGGRRLIRR